LVGFLVLDSSSLFWKICVLSLNFGLVAVFC
jgi:hypothetical protein